MSQTAGTRLGIDRIGQIAIPVADLPRAVEFYRDVLGLTLLFQAPPGLAFFDCGGVRLMLDANVEESAGSSSVLYYRVDDLDRAFNLLEGAGASIVAAPHLIAKMPDHELWMAFFRDTEGNLGALMSERRS